VWLPWPELEAICQLDLRPPSLWPVFLAVLGTSRRYGGNDAKLEVDDLARLTGLSRRTVQAALSKLMATGLVVRVGRYGVLQVSLAGSTGTDRGASLSAPPGAPPEPARSADKLAPRKRKLACASPTSIYVYSLDKEVRGAGVFSAKQQRVIADVLAEASELLGADASQLSLPTPGAENLGLPAGTTFGEAFRIISLGDDRAAARDFTRLVLGLRQDERVQGEELPLT
jgi:hypothetical protein